MRLGKPCSPTRPPELLQPGQQGSLLHPSGFINVWASMARPALPTWLHVNQDTCNTTPWIQRMETRTGIQSHDQCQAGTTSFSNSSAPATVPGATTESLSPAASVPSQGNTVLLKAPK
ncbi:hypothetical protein FKM82_028552 [Ascaphus truei]